MASGNSKYAVTLRPYPHKLMEDRLYITCDHISIGAQHTRFYNLDSSGSSVDVAFIFNSEIISIVKE